MLEILRYPNTVLDTCTQRVEEIDDDILKKIHSMFDTMYENEGIGLAANQVGIDKSIIVFDCSEDGESPRCLINPHITSERGQSLHSEGCLSFPGISLTILRSKEIDVSFMDINGKNQNMTFEGIESICVQHEIDHLLGKTFLSRANRSTRRRVLKALRKKK